MKLFLAPMEGVIDHHMRNILSRIGGYDHCVTEFLRISDGLLPVSSFRRICPELANGCETASGTPVTIQLLGGDPVLMAENAQRAVEVGATAVDINFGCPSRFVNRRAGGSVLLKEPHRVYKIIAAVRQVVPAQIPVSAKIRLGFESTDLALENAQAVEAANADFVTVHARTKVDGYTYPARWEWLAKINETLSIPMVANGDINSVSDFVRCREISGCENFMLGRGAVTHPDLARQITETHHAHQLTSPMLWKEVLALLSELIMVMQQQTHPKVMPGKILGRIKQWLAYLKRQYPEAAILFREIRALRELSDVEVLLKVKVGPQ